MTWFVVSVVEGLTIVAVATFTVWARRLVLRARAQVEMAMEQTEKATEAFKQANDPKTMNTANEWLNFLGMPNTMNIPSPEAARAELKEAARTGEWLPPMRADDHRSKTDVVTDLSPGAVLVLWQEKNACKT